MNLMDRLAAGHPPSSFTAAEAQALGEDLMRDPAYRNSRDRDHAAVSQTVAALMARANPGVLDANGAVSFPGGR